jgi:activator of HSP90 ATPase
MKTKTIKQTVILPVTPKELYTLLLDSKKMSTIHNGKTSMTKRANGKFTVFDGYCQGYNMELVEGKRIVQAWHFNESGWPDDHFSVCTFLLEPNSKGTKLTFIQTDVPSQNYDSLNEGWYTYYWNPIEQYLKRK